MLQKVAFSVSLWYLYVLVWQLLTSVPAQADNTPAPATLIAAHIEESESSAEQAPRKKPRRPRRESVVRAFHCVQLCLSLMLVLDCSPTV